MVLGQYMSVPMELARKIDNEEHVGLRNTSTEHEDSINNMQYMSMDQDG